MVSSRFLAMAFLAFAAMPGVLAGRFYVLGLASAYPVLFAFLVFDSLILGVSSLVGTASNAYFWVYLIGYPVIWLMYILIVKELYGLIFRRYPGLATLGRWCIYGAVCLAVVGFLTAGYAAQNAVRDLRQTGVVHMESTGRVIVFGLAVLVIFILLAISRFPLTLHRNVLINSIFFSGILLWEAGALLADQLTGLKHTVAINIASSVMDTACFLAWLFLLSSQGEKEIVKVHIAGNNHDESRKLAQLERFNEMLLRIMRKKK